MNSHQPTFSSEVEFLSARLAYPSWVGGDEDYLLLTITVDGEDYEIRGMSSTVYDIQTLIATINASPVGALIQAGVTYNATYDTFQLTFTGNPNVSEISVLDIGIFTDPAPDPLNENGVYAAGLVDEEFIAPTDAQHIDQLEPVNEGNELERVYIPIHTRITSNPPDIQADYWAVYTHAEFVEVGQGESDAVSLTPVSSVSSTHPLTQEPILYTLYVNNNNNNWDQASGMLTLDCRYAIGPKGGTLVTDMVNRVMFKPMLPGFYADSSDQQPKILSASMTIDDSQSIYIKSIVSGYQAADLGDYAGTSCCSLIKFSANLSEFAHSVNGGGSAYIDGWSHRQTYSNILYDVFEVPGYGSYQRSDDGLIVCADGNIVMTNNVMVQTTNEYNEDVLGPAVEVVKIDSNTGYAIWTKIISSVNGLLIDSGDTIESGTIPLGSHLPISAWVDVNDSDDIFIGHRQFVHKLTPTGEVAWSKVIPIVVSNDDGYITGLQVSKTSSSLFIAVSGVMDSQEARRGAVLKITDNSATQNPLVFWSVDTGDRVIDDPWGGDEYSVPSIPPAINIHLDEDDDVLYVAVRRYDGDVETSGITIQTVSTSDMTLNWSYDNWFTKIRGHSASFHYYDHNDNDWMQLAGPVVQQVCDANGTHPLFGGGRISFSIIPATHKTPKGICFSAPLGRFNPYISEGESVFVSRGGWIVVHNPYSPPISSGGIDSEVSYTFQDMTQYDNNDLPAPEYNDSVVVRAMLSNIIQPEDAVISTDVHGSTNITANFMPNSANPLVGNVIDYKYIIPPTVANVTPSLHVDYLTKVGGLQLGDVLPAPPTLVGTPGDLRGMLRCDANGVYFCHTDYNGRTPIWGIASFGGAFRQIPPGYNSSSETITGGPKDKVGELYITEHGEILVCISEYDSNSDLDTWVIANSPSVPPGRLKCDRRVDYKSSDNNDYHPSGSQLVSAWFDWSVEDQPIPEIPNIQSLVEVSGYCNGPQPANTTIFQYVASRQMYISDVGAVFKCGSGSSATIAIDVNGTTIGEVEYNEFSSTGKLTLGWGIKTLAPGDVLTISTGSNSSNIANVFFSIPGVHGVPTFPMYEATDRVLGSSPPQTVRGSWTDDQYTTVSTPFPVQFLGTNYSQLHVGANSFITFGQGYNTWNSFSGNNPPAPGIHVAASDNSVAYIRTSYETSKYGPAFRVRFEGRTNNSMYGVLDLVWEAIFYKDRPDIVDVVIGQNGRPLWQPGFSGFTNGTEYICVPETPYKSYRVVFS